MQLEALRGGHLFVSTGISAIHVEVVVFSLADLFIHCFESRLIVCFLANNDIVNTINHQHLFTLHHFISLENMKVVYYHPQPAVLLCRQHTLLSTSYHYVTYWLTVFTNPPLPTVVFFTLVFPTNQLTPTLIVLR